MPRPPEGEAPLRDLARAFGVAEVAVRGLVLAAPSGDRSDLVARASSILVQLRQLDFRGALIKTYISAFRAAGVGGELRPPTDLAGGLAKRLDQGADRASVRASQSIREATEGNVEEMQDAAVVAHVDDRGTTWSLGRWAEMNTTTYGRQASSRALVDALGAGGRFVVDVGECALCRRLFSGGGVVGEDPLPPGHPGCTCTASAA
jgi:hypothetical protein